MSLLAYLTPEQRAAAHAAANERADDGLTAAQRWALLNRGLSVERWPGGFRVRGADGAVVKMLAPDPAAVAAWIDANLTP